MDGKFDYNGDIIGYKISDNPNTGIKKVNGMEKMARHINYYNDKNEAINNRGIYDEAEKMQNITPEDALRWYKELVEK